MPERRSPARSMPIPEPLDALVIGAGPGGLMAAEALASAGRRVVVAERMPTPGRKLLMAGRSGLNLTRAEPIDAMARAYGSAWARLAPMIEAMDADGVQTWAGGLGQALFTGSTGRVFPEAMKASPLLRAWRGRLGAAGVEIRPRWDWIGTGHPGEGEADPVAGEGGAASLGSMSRTAHDPDGMHRDSPAPERGASPFDGALHPPHFLFDTPEGRRAVRAGVVVLALGGASWRRLGSDGAWASILAARRVPMVSFAPANVGLSVRWSEPMARHFGAPVKGAALSAGGRASRGELVVSARGLEGGGVYALGPAVREGAPLALDLAPDRDEGSVERALARVPAKASLSNRLRRALRLSPVKIALLHEWGERDVPLARRIKALPVRHDGPRPIDEAISVAGGVAWEGLDDALMLRAMPGVFACGEMLDWEAPTGGYLLTACLATGRWAGTHAAAWPGEGGRVGSG